MQNQLMLIAKDPKQTKAMLKDSKRKNSWKDYVYFFKTDFLNNEPIKYVQNILQRPIIFRGQFLWRMASPWISLEIYCLTGWLIHITYDYSNLTKIKLYIKKEIEILGSNISNISLFFLRFWIIEFKFYIMMGFHVSKGMSF